MWFINQPTIYLNRYVIYKSATDLYKSGVDLQNKIRFINYTKRHNFGTDGTPYTTAPNYYSAALGIILLIWSLCKYSSKYSLVRRSPCKIGGVLVRNLLRESPCKLFLEGVVVTLPGVFVSYEDSL